uniref:Putative secreted peptide n=1 Tax=Anopheles braziliensis TaxID=58242 RepID=A0A2M3ZQJ0_9DIPT
MFISILITTILLSINFASTSLILANSRNPNPRGLISWFGRWKARISGFDMIVSCCDRSGLRTLSSVILILPLNGHSRW